MLIVTIDLIHGVYSPSQKRNLIHRVTEAAVEVEGEAMRNQIFVKMNEVSPDGWAVGGTPLGRGAGEWSIEEQVGDAESRSTLRRINRILGKGG